MTLKRRSQAPTRLFIKWLLFNTPSATRLESVYVAHVSVIAIMSKSITITTSKTVVSINGLIIYALLSKEIVIKQSPAVFSPVLPAKAR